MLFNRHSIWFLLFLLLIPIASGHTAEFSTKKFFYDLEGNASSDGDGVDIGFKKANQNLFSTKAHDNLSGIKYFRNHISTLLSSSLFTKDHLNRLFSFLGSESQNLRTETSRFFSEHIKDLLHDGIISTNQITGFSERVYDNPKNHLIFLGLMDALIKNGLVSKNYMSTEYGFNLLDGVGNENKTISELSTNILSKHGSTLSLHNLMQQSHVTRFVAMSKDLKKDNYANYLSIFEQNITTWVDQGVIGSKDVQSILSFMTQFPVELMDQLFEFLAKPKTVASLKQLGLYSPQWVASIRRDIMGGTAESKQNSLNMLSYMLKPFVSTGALSGKEFKELWGHIQSQMDAFDDPFVVHRRNYKSLSRYGWFARNDYEKLLFGLEEKSPNTQTQTLEFVDSIFDWLRVRNWLGMSKLSKAVSSPAGGTLNLRKLGFKPLANAVLSNETGDKSLELKKASFVRNHVDTIVDNELFTKEYIRSYIKKLYSKDSDIFTTAADATEDGLSHWYEQGIISTAEINMIFERSNQNSNRTARLLDIINANFSTIVPLFNKNMINTYSLYFQSSNPTVAIAAESFFENHITAILKHDLLSQASRRNIRALNLIGSPTKHSSGSKYRKRIKTKSRASNKNWDGELIGD